MTSHVVYALAWLSFAAQHSLLARPAWRQRLERRFGAWHRLAYNAMAVGHLAAVLALGKWLLGERESFAWLEGARGPMFALALLGAALVVAALGHHDLCAFVGWRQLRQQAVGLSEAGRREPEPLRTAGLYRWTRHPLYLGTLLFLWGFARNPLGLATAIWGSIYVVIGTLLEERDLVRKFGFAYREYQARVPMFIPRPW